MARTFYQDFKRDDGNPVTVEYQFRNLSAAIAEASIVNAWLDHANGLFDVELTDAERDRMEAWLVEHHENED